MAAVICSSAAVGFAFDFDFFSLSYLSLLVQTLNALVAPSALGVFLAGQLSRASRWFLVFFLSWFKHSLFSKKMD